MNLIFIYGPPAVGKLTVAKELAKITHYKNFHNHIAHDFVESFVHYQNPKFFKYIEQLMLKGITFAAKEDISLIFTYCYDNKHDNAFVKKVMNNVKKYNGSVKFVQLTCSQEELFKRVKHESRKRYGKVKSVKVLKQLLHEWHLGNSIFFVKNLRIDNTTIKPKKVALKIKKEYHL
jgi:tRNA uridine 5-carbamoylmethylation protein Kti12